MSGVDYWCSCVECGEAFFGSKYALRCKSCRAQAGEAGTAETPKSGSVHEHAVGNADAPKGGTA